MAGFENIQAREGANKILDELVVHLTREKGVPVRRADATLIALREALDRRTIGTIVPVSLHPH